MPPDPPANPSAISVTFEYPPGKWKTVEFHRSFKIGRVEDCDVCIRSEFVSRVHAKVELAIGHWWIEDLNSSNGLFVAGNRVERAEIQDHLTVRLGMKGPTIELRIKAPPQKINSVDRYFGKVGKGESLGEHTVMVRRAFAEIQAKQRWRYGGLVAVLAAILAVSAGYTIHLQQQVSKNKATAEELFYSMKALDVNIANIERKLGSGSTELVRLQKGRQEAELNYNRFLTTLKVYDPRMSEQRRLILRVARIFGECELAMPPAFADEIENYIRKWQSSGRLVKDVALAREKGYTTLISHEFREMGLPDQFFYLALQESDFDPFVSGPPTRSGYAKGMWQFIPKTAMKYGLRIGPLVDFPRADTGDDRDHYDRATKAAAQYIKDLYGTDAQASGLLVMACYNWGEDRVLPLIQSLPVNPRERNFWQLLTRYRDKIPPETYNYVFSIASAAVIGEDPHLFGFNFDNPLAESARTTPAIPR